jgi:hypothetical protein
MVEITGEDEIVISQDFVKVVKDLSKDLMGTFPDILEKSDNPIKEISKLEENDEDEEKLETLVKVVYAHCKEVFPKHFFDILYENNDIYNDNEELFLLPNINFVALWKTDISDSTRSTIWKYLQLILFTVVADVNTGESFGDTAKLFEAINTEEFKEKIEASLEEMENVFKEKNFGEGVEVGDDKEMELPKAEELHDHINKMMGGKIGCLAKEIAEETAEELDIDMSDSTSVNDVFNKLFKNPTKLMDLVKNVGTKLDTKIKSGDIKETELLQEATDFVSNMKNMPGMGNLESLFKKMGVPGMGGGGKMDIGAMTRNMEQNLKNAKMKERMRNKLDKKRAEASNSKEINGEIKEKGVNDFGMQELVYSLGEHAEKTKADSRPRNNKKKKKKKPVDSVMKEVSEN